MKRFSMYAIGSLCALASLATTASAQVLTFEGLADFAQVSNFYNGGAGGNFGVVFSTGSLALVKQAGGGTGLFQNNPSGVTALFFTNSNNSVMNVTGGFTTGFAFFYAGATSGSAEVFSAPDAGGTLLVTVPIAATTGTSDWTSVGGGFAGTAYSVRFNGVANFSAFDNITIGDTVAAQAVPEPSAFVVGGIAMSLLTGLIVRKRRRNTLG